VNFLTPQDAQEAFDTFRGKVDFQLEFSRRKTYDYNYGPKNPKNKRPELESNHTDSSPP